MKKLSLLFILLVVVNIITNKDVYAYEYPNVREVTYEEKPWSIKFSSPFDKESISNETIYIENLNDNSKLKVEYVLFEDGKVIIYPSEKYVEGMVYQLAITEGVKSKAGYSLKEEVVMKFTYKNIEPKDTIN